MNCINKLTYRFRTPKYPVIVDLDGVLVAAKSAKSLFEKLSQLDIVEKKSYDAIVGTGDDWCFMRVGDDGILSPLNISLPRTKLELIRWFNNRQNKPADEVEYSEKSASSKTRDRIIAEIVQRLIDADKRIASLNK